MYVTRMTYGTRRRGGEAYPAILDDGNTVAWFDKAVNITKDGSDFVSVWGDKSGNSNNLLQAVGTNQPLWSADGVLFDGLDNFMKCLAFTLVQPEFIYMVVKQVSYNANDIFFDGNLDATGIVYQSSLPNKLTAYAGSTSSENENLAIDTYGIVRVLFNGAASKFQINETVAITGDFGASDMGGFILANRVSTAAPSNIEVKEIIIRKVADTAPNEAAIYAYLASKYSIS